MPFGRFLPGRLIDHLNRLQADGAPWWHTLVNQSENDLFFAVRNGYCDIYSSKVVDQIEGSSTWLTENYSRPLTSPPRWLPPTYTSLIARTFCTTLPAHEPSIPYCCWNF